jgi:hypothetical protein
MRNLLVISCFLLCQFSLFGQIEEVRRITKTLCSPKFHGRGYVNGGDSLAAHFIADEFKKIGVKPLKKTYFQQFSLSVNTFPGKMEMKMGEKVLKPGIHFLVDPSSSSNESIWKPKLISAKTALNKDLLLKEIRFVIESKEFNSVAFDFAGLPADTMKLLGGIIDQVAEALPVIEVTSSKFTWSVGRNQLKHAVIQIQDSIFQDGKEWNVTIEAKFVQNHSTQNVIAYLPSKNKKAKTIVFTAHYDHLGRMGTDTYFPGGNDNASGTAMLLSMAMYFKAHPSNCNILFIAFAGEEAGLVGSEYFVNHPTFKLKKINFLVNLDIMGSGEEGITVVNATAYEKEFLEIQKINEENNLLAQVKKRGQTQNSDHYWFSTKGVPAFFIYTQGPNKNYHDVFDTYENLSFKEYDDITTLLVKFVDGFIEVKEEKK